MRCHGIMLINTLHKAREIPLKIINETSAVTKILALVSSYFAPVTYFVGVLFIFVILDTFSAIFRDYKKTERRQSCILKNKPKSIIRLRRVQLFFNSIQKDGLYDTVEKFISYPIIIGACYIFDTMVLKIEPEKIINGFSYTFTSFSFVIIAFADFQSFIRNMANATEWRVYKQIEKLIVKKKDSFERDNT